MDLEALCSQAVSFHRNGDLAEAERIYAQVLSADPNNFTACHLLGVLRSQQGQHTQAQQLISRALSKNSTIAAVWCNYGLVLQALRQFDEAIASYDRALALNPNFLMAMWSRGNTLRDLRRLDEALLAYDGALKLNATHAESWYNRGLTLWDLRRFSDSLFSYDQALAIKPDLAAAWNNRGNALRELRQFEEALKSFERALAIDPRNPEAICNRGLTLRGLARYEEALSCFSAAIEINPHYGNALLYTGETELSQENFEMARVAFERLLAIQPSHSEAANNLGVALWNLGRTAEAIPNYERALASKPKYLEALINRGIAQRDLKRFSEALSSFNEALSIDENRAQVWNDRGSALRDVGDFEKALTSFNRALAIQPNYTDALFNRSYLQWYDLHRHDEALIDFQNAIALDPNRAYAQGDLFHLRMHMGDWKDFAQRKAALIAAVRSGSRSARPFVFQAISDSPADIRKCATTYYEHLYSNASILARRNAHHKPRIRVGYMSGEFRQQATSYLLAGLFELHDKSRFEIIAVDDGASDGSPMRARLEASFDKFINIANVSDEQAAREIQAKEIDILVNLNGYFGHCRMGIFSRRPAPIQVNYLGFPGTLGARCIDYILADNIVIPESDQSHYTEHVAYLPSSYQANDSKRKIDSSPTSRSDWTLPENAFVLCNFNQSYKLTPEVFSIWMDILRQTANSVLWLLDCGATFTKNLRSSAAKIGVDPNRIIFARQLPLEKHLARLQHANLMLDTLPCNAHTTASDALWSGVPIVTCRGNAFSGRVAASLLNGCGLPHLAVDTLDQYRALAIRLIENSDELETIRAFLAQNRLSMALFDTQTFTSNLERAYEIMWDNFLSGKQPDSFHV